MKSKRHLNRRRHKRSSKNKKGGLFGFFESKHNSSNPACDVNNLANLKSSEQIHSNYQTCCPKGTFGTKNSSPYCKQLELNLKPAITNEVGDPNSYVPQAQGNLDHNNKSNSSWFSSLFGSKKPTPQSPSVNNLANRRVDYENGNDLNKSFISPEDRNSDATTVDWGNPDDESDEMQRYSTVTNNGQNYQGGRRKSRKQRKSRKHRKSRKSRKSRKH
jgi:hypothetical protein